VGEKNDNSCRDCQIISNMKHKSNEKVITII
jgi:hypothetical protein